MARTNRDAKLDNRTGRLKLAVGRRYVKTIHDGLALVYRRPVDGSGAWSVRIFAAKKHTYIGLGVADDYADADGADVFTFTEASQKAAKVAREHHGAGRAGIGPLTVDAAADNYMAWFETERKSVSQTRNFIDTHIRPALGDDLVSDLKAKDIKAWLKKVADAPARARSSKHAGKVKHRQKPTTDDAKRARKASANRVLGVLKAILNQAFENGDVPSDIEWRRVTPFEKVDSARIRFLEPDECIRLLAASEDDFRPLVRAALTTGARYGEMQRLRAGDINIRTGLVYIAQSKSGKARHIPMSDEAKKFFADLIEGKDRADLLLTHADGRPWGKNHQVRPLADASALAQIVPGVQFHALRHTFASLLIQNGVDILTVSKLLGHADTRVTARHYAHLADRHLAAAVQRMPLFVVPKNKVRALHREDAPMVRERFAS